MKIIIFTLITLLLFVPACNAAVSEDMSVYLRKDVFEAKMDAFMSEIRLMNEQTRGEIRALSERLDGKISALSSRVDGLESKVDAKIDSLETKLNTRIDGLEAKVNAKIDSLETKLNTRIDGLESKVDAKIDGLEAKLNTRMDGVEAKSSTRMDGIDTRMDGIGTRIDDLRNGIYLWLVIITAIFGYIEIRRKKQEREAAKEIPTTQSITLEDVKNLVLQMIEENNSRLRKSVQA